MKKLGGGTLIFLQQQAKIIQQPISELICL